MAPNPGCTACPPPAWVTVTPESMLRSVGEVLKETAFFRGRIFIPSVKRGLLFFLLGIHWVSIWSYLGAHSPFLCLWSCQFIQNMKADSWSALHCSNSSSKPAWRWFSPALGLRAGDGSGQAWCQAELWDCGGLCSAGKLKGNELLNGCMDGEEKS